MVLEIKGTIKENDIIELRRGAGNAGVILEINGNTIAYIHDNGDFVFHGTTAREHEGRWKK